MPTKTSNNAVAESAKQTESVKVETEPTEEEDNRKTLIILDNKNGKPAVSKDIATFPAELRKAVRLCKTQNDGAKDFTENLKIFCDLLHGIRTLTEKTSITFEVYSADGEKVETRSTFAGFYFSLLTAYQTYPVTSWAKPRESKKGAKVESSNPFAGIEL